ncbi:S-adenosyl-L-methionine-dependent methyltransferase [Patellaria atrata CBS 101060]|uniref:S-adenosyl-L-methionine-dependent methyltransferase n=1 Tax=Patellaria atrata CBS 101060 TaxID=1346257 RepID=A0A9P4VVX8_9PEZI|nr:S-adenosyl-L-methionine-dependent methyltransferase [Patellaria atrata CBS 101060]
MVLNADVDDLINTAISILVSANTIKSFLAEKNLPQPSILNDPSPALFAPELDAARDDILNACHKVQALISAPVHTFGMGLQAHYLDLGVFQWVHHFKVAQAVPLDKTITFEELASATGTPIDILRRMVRYSMTSFVFHEPQPGYVAHTARSRLLLDSSAISLCDLTAEWLFHCADQFAPAVEKWPGSQELNETSYNLSLKTDLPFFQFISQKPAAVAKFGKLMMSFAAGQDWIMKEVAQECRWNDLGKATLVDVGGSIGHTSMVIADVVPDFDFVVEDLPEVVQQGQKVLLENRPELKDRFNFLAHNFFEPQTSDGDIYLLRCILHDYPDKYAIKIVENLLPALKKKNGTRMVIYERIVPLPGAVSVLQERLVRAQDIQMWSCFNSKERELEEWKELVAKVDPGLKLTKVVTPHGSLYSAMEFMFY